MRDKCSQNRECLKKSQIFVSSRAFWVAIYGMLHSRVGVYPKGGMALLKAPIYTVIRGCPIPVSQLPFLLYHPLLTESGQAQHVFGKHHKFPGAVLDAEDIIFYTLRI